MSSVGATHQPELNELAWLRGVLWGASPELEALVGREAPAGFRPLDEWVILPDHRRPRVLVPLRSRRAAAAAIRQYSDGMTQRARLAKALVGLGLESGVLQRTLRRRGSVLRVGALADRLDAAGQGTLLHDYLPRALGRDDLAAAIVLGPARLNRKPVLQLVDPRGRTIGYVKVGWNDLTRRLVRNEAAMLTRLAAARPQTFTAPGLLHHGQWQGLEVTVSAALPHGLWRRGRRYRLPPLAVSQEIAGLGGIERSPLATSGWWQGLRRRLAPVAARGGRATELLGPALELLEGQAADAVLAFGSWHGDWGPWNLRTTREGLLVWDWERSGDAVPVGLDLLHFGYLTGVQGLRRPSREAAEASLRRATPLLGALGQPPEAAELLLALYLLELFHRVSEAAPSAVTGRPDSLGADLLEVLRRRLGLRR